MKKITTLLSIGLRCYPCRRAVYYTSGPHWPTFIGFASLYFIKK